MYNKKIIILLTWIALIKAIPLFGKDKKIEQKNIYHVVQMNKNSDKKHLGLLSSIIDKDSDLFESGDDDDGNVVHHIHTFENGPTHVTNSYYPPGKPLSESYGIPEYPKTSYLPSDSGASVYNTLPKQTQLVESEGYGSYQTTKSKQMEMASLFGNLAGAAKGLANLANETQIVQSTSQNKNTRCNLASATGGCHNVEKVTTSLPLEASTTIFQINEELPVPQLYHSGFGKRITELKKTSNDLQGAESKKSKIKEASPSKQNTLTDAVTTTVETTEVRPRSNEPQDQNKISQNHSVIPKNYTDQNDTEIKNNIKRQNNKDTQNYGETQNHQGIPNYFGVQSYDQPQNFANTPSNIGTHAGLAANSLFGPHISDVLQNHGEIKNIGAPSISSKQQNHIGVQSLYGEESSSVPLSYFGDSFIGVQNSNENKKFNEQQNYVGAQNITDSELLNYFGESYDGELNYDVFQKYFISQNYSGVSHYPKIENLIKAQNNIRSQDSVKTKDSHKTHDSNKIQDATVKGQSHLWLQNFTNFRESHSLPSQTKSQQNIKSSSNGGGSSIHFDIDPYSVNDEATPSLNNGQGAIKSTIKNFNNYGTSKNYSDSPTHNGIKILGQEKEHDEPQIYIGKDYIGTQKYKEISEPGTHKTGYFSDAGKQNHVELQNLNKGQYELKVFHPITNKKIHSTISQNNTRTQNYKDYGESFVGAHNYNEPQKAGDPSYDDPHNIFRTQNHGSEQYHAKIYNYPKVNDFPKVEFESKVVHSQAWPQRPLKSNSEVSLVNSENKSYTTPRISTLSSRVQSTPAPITSTQNVINYNGGEAYHNKSHDYVRAHSHHQPQKVKLHNYNGRQDLSKSHNYDRKHHGHTELHGGTNGQNHLHSFTDTHSYNVLHSGSHGHNELHNYDGTNHGHHQHKYGETHDNNELNLVHGQQHNGQLGHYDQHSHNGQHNGHGHSHNKLHGHNELFDKAHDHNGYNELFGNNEKHSYNEPHGHNEHHIHNDHAHNELFGHNEHAFSEHGHGHNEHVHSEHVHNEHVHSEHGHNGLGHNELFDHNELGHSEHGNNELFDHNQQHGHNDILDKAHHHNELYSPNELHNGLHGNNEFYGEAHGYNLQNEPHDHNEPQSHSDHIEGPNYSGVQNNGNVHNYNELVDYLLQNYVGHQNNVAGQGLVNDPGAVEHSSEGAVGINHVEIQNVTKEPYHNPHTLQPPTTYNIHPLNNVPINNGLPPQHYLPSHPYLPVHPHAMYQTIPGENVVPMPGPHGMQPPVFPLLTAYYPISPQNMNYLIHVKGRDKQAMLNYLHSELYHLQHPYSVVKVYPKHKDSVPVKILKDIVETAKQLSLVPSYVASHLRSAGRGAVKWAIWPLAEILRYFIQVLSKDEYGQPIPINMPYYQQIPNYLPYYYQTQINLPPYHQTAINSPHNYQTPNNLPPSHQMPNNLHPYHQAPIPLPHYHQIPSTSHHNHQILNNVSPSYQTSNSLLSNHQTPIIHLSHNQQTVTLPPYQQTPTNLPYYHQTPASMNYYALPNHQTQVDYSSLPLNNYKSVYDPAPRYERNLPTLDSTPQMFSTKKPDTKI